MGDYVFNVCESLREVHIPDGVEGIGIAIFLKCPFLQNSAEPFTVYTDNAYAIEHLTNEYASTTLIQFKPAQ